MKTNELRIGNLVKVRDEIVKVEQITKKKIGYHKEPRENVMHYAKLCEVEPIVLTEDVMDMIRCEDKWADGYSPVYSLREGFYVKCRAIDGSLDFVKIDSTYLHIKYLHQLQNWYYMFNNKELEVKL